MWDDASVNQWNRVTEDQKSNITNRREDGLPHIVSKWKENSKTLERERERERELRQPVVLSSNEKASVFMLQKKKYKASLLVLSSPSRYFYYYTVRSLGRLVAVVTVRVWVLIGGFWIGGLEIHGRMKSDGVKWSCMVVLVRRLSCSLRWALPYD